jgi:4-hydroxybenzoyl-CoA thioesterase
VSDFVRRVPVHWNDCDPARIVFHSHYVRWMDEGFHEMARARGVDFAELQAAEPGFRGTPLVAISCAFRAPALYGDTLEHRIAPPDSAAGAPSASGTPSARTAVSWWRRASKSASGA